MIHIIESIDIAPILKEYDSLEKDIVWYEAGSKKQTGLQYLEGEDQWISATGKSRKDIAETQFTLINPFFKNTIFETLIVKFKLLRARLMWVGPHSTYSMHRDTTPRIHIPMITNPDCYFVFQKGIVKHLPTGHVYWINTMDKHTFMNCSEQSRLHLIGVTESML